MHRQVICFHDYGLIPYRECLGIQEKFAQQLIHSKLQTRYNKNMMSRHSVLHHLIFCEHPHVFTLGKSGSKTNLLISEEELKAKNICFFNTNRGGDITYHGPGQLVAYPVLDLDCFFTDVSIYLRSLENVIIKTLEAYHIKASHYPGYTGVWVEPHKPEHSRKICAIGVHLSHWVSTHGFALNINTDLSYFSHIVPCGIKNKKVTSMQHELGKTVNMYDVKQLIKENFAEIFNTDFIYA